jgi:hypothetical protein
VLNLRAAGSAPSLWISPPPLARLRPDEYVWSKAGDLSYREPIIYDRAQCWATEIPCVPEPNQANFGTVRAIRFRKGEGDFGGGFVEGR